MSDASKYPISFPYGATTDPYSAAHPHRGDDRACPQGTPVIINGTVVGLTGATGKATGPHLHIQEWRDSYFNVRKPQNAFVGGTVVNIDPTQTQGDGSFGKFVTVQTGDGWNDSYCHLSEIFVTVGQELKGEIAMGVTIEGIPASVSWGPGRIDVFAKGSDGGLYHCYFNEKGWQRKGDWEKLPGGVKELGSASSTGVGELNIFGTGDGGTLYHWWLQPDGTWGVEDLGVPKQ